MTEIFVAHGGKPAVGDKVPHLGKLWRVLWVMTLGPTLHFVGVETLSASAEALTPNHPAAPDGAASQQQKDQ